jgi:holo-[acyl-carrier protein] synthase
MENKLIRSVEEIISGRKFAAGNDLVYLPNFQSSLTDLFKKKAYTPAEIAYCDSFNDSVLRFASTWAAKEAVYKAVKQLDPKALSWKKIEIIREKPGGRPHVILHQGPGKFNVGLTISHDGDYVWAIAFIEFN